MNPSESETRICRRCGQPLDPRTGLRTCTRCALDDLWAAAPETNLAADMELRLDDLGGETEAMDRIEGFDLIRQIARGGAGVVFLARQRRLDRLVALKLLVGGFHASPEIKARFQLEAQTAARLHHPNIVPIYEVGEYHGQPYIAMEYVDGPDLSKRSRGTPIDARQAARYALEVARAIHYAHTREVLHRDLKPSNILIGPDDRPRVTDFGLARSLASDSKLTLSGATLGTPAYLPPEQASTRYGEVGPASDVYAVGAILYDLLAGRPPFLSSTVADTLRAVTESDPLPLRIMNPAVPRDLEVICLKCLEKLPTRRYPTAAALAGDLEHFLADEPISARPPTAFEKLRKSFRRHRVAYLSAGLALLVAGAAAALVGRAFARERAARRHADQAALHGEHVSRFLRTIVLGIHPSVALGRDTTLLRELLTDAAARMDRELADEPLVRADLYLSIGQAYQSLGDLPTARSMYRKSVDLRTSQLGTEDPRVADSLYALGHSLLVDGELETAESTLRQALDIQVRTRGPDDLHRTHIGASLASLYWRQGRRDEAIGMARENVDHWRRLRGERDPETANAMNNLAYYLHRVGDCREAEDFIRQALDQHAALQPEPNPTRAGMLANLGAALAGQSRHDEAEEKLREALSIQERMLPADDRNLAWTRSVLGRVLAARGRREEALTVLLPALRVLDSTLGSDHELTTEVRAALDWIRRN